MDKIFVIAIGGTGMRCLESFVHLCAIGMFDNQDIDILTLDTDATNGNKGRVEELIDLYNKVKRDDDNNPKDIGEPLAKTFFSARLHLYKFYTTYGNQDRKNYKVLARLSSGANKEENQELSDLFFDKDTVQEFDLDHGYRAQTHLGSMLMYDGIIEAARNVTANANATNSAEKALSDFLTKLQANQNAARVFVFGSIFGGTGASSIPIIPVALRDAIQIISGGSMTLDTSKVKFGSTLLTQYFLFKQPDNIQRADDKVVADSSNFALNCQAALQFYQSDPTVRHTYKRFYHIGWPFSYLDVTNKGAKTVIGGREQKNNCHVAELFCAAAAYDFFNLDDKALENEEAKYLFRVIDSKGGQIVLHGSDFVGNGNEFETKLGAFFSFAHIVLSKYEAAWTSEKGAGTKGLINRFNAQKIDAYNGLTDNQANDIDEYLKRFAYCFKGKEIEKGWIYQINDTVRGEMQGRFIFSDDAFKEKLEDVKNISCGHLFDEQSRNWSKLTGVFSKKDNSVDVLIRNMSDTKTLPRPEQAGASTKERFLAHIHNAITVNEKV